MPSLPLPVSHGQRHPRNGHRLLKTGPTNRKQQIEPFHVWAERWLIYLRRYKYAMIGVASAAIAVYCPPSPFSSARERHQHLGTHYPTTFSTMHSRCSFSRMTSSREPTTVDQDTESAYMSLEKLKFKLAASKSVEESLPPTSQRD